MAESTDSTTRRSVVIEYCVQCNYLGRALWHAGELMRLFPTEISVTLVPSSGGRYRVLVDEQVLWDKESSGRFPEIDEIFELLNKDLMP